MMKALMINALLLLAFAALMVQAPEASAALTVKANHDRLDVDYNYHGGAVSVSGEADPGVELIIKIASPSGEEELMRKDRVGGILWMNTEKVEFGGVPGVYYLASTRTPEEILETSHRMANGIGYDALAETAEITGHSNPEARGALFDEFIKYKEAKRLFSRSAGDVAVKPDADGQAYRTVFQWPYQAPPGRYIVTAYAVKDGAVVDKAETEVHVQQVGVVKLLADMAQNRGGLYGLVAVVIALAAGFGVGMLFRTGGGAH
ncbi:MAG: TIGR02186 family protein [Nitrospirota bacterium]|jgi:uncharacterized protein (TIGR02186 family)